MGNYCYVASTRRHARRWGAHERRRGAGAYHVASLLKTVLLSLQATRLLSEQAVRKAATVCPVTQTFDLLTLKVVSESRVTWVNPVPILVFLGLSVLDLGPMYATDRRQTKASLNAPPIRGGA